MNDLHQYKIEIHEPFSKFLLGSDSEVNFDLSLMDAVRLSGHACPSIVGAFFLCKEAIKELFPLDHICRRGEVKVFHSRRMGEGPTGPISNVFGLVLGSWGDSGFPGLGDQFVRKGMQEFGCKNIPSNHFLFVHVPSERKVLLEYDLSALRTLLSPADSFQQSWRELIELIANKPLEAIRKKEL